MNYIVFDRMEPVPRRKEKRIRSFPLRSFRSEQSKLNDQWKNATVSGKDPALVYHSFHCHTQEVLHMDMKAFRKARPFYEVIPSFLEWCGPMEDAVFCSPGPLDLLELQRNLRFYHIKNPFPFPLYYLDIQKIFSLQREDGCLKISSPSSMPWSFPRISPSMKRWETPPIPPESFRLG